MVHHLLSATLLAISPAAGEEASPPSARPHASLKEGIGIDSADGRFGGGIGFFGQLRHETVVGPSPSRGFVLLRARPYILAHLWGNTVDVLVQPELAGTPSLLDARAQVTLHPAFGLMLGKYRPWSTRGFRVGLPFVTVLDRGVVLDSFRIDRDLGITFLGAPFGGRLEYYVGILNGDGPKPGKNVDAQMLYTARIVVAPLGPMPYSQTRYLHDDDLRLAVGANAYTNVQPDSEVALDPVTGGKSEMKLDDKRIVGISGDFAASVSIVGIEAEGFWRRALRPDRPDTFAWGTYGQVATLIVPHRLEAAFRVGVMQLEDDADPHLPISPALGIYIADDHAKLAFRYTCDIIAGEDVCSSHVMIGQAQLLF